MKRFYVSGAIAGHNGFREKFERGCEEVRALGHEPVNPCDFDGTNFTWEECMVHDLHVLLDCDGIYALRDWKRSRGATIEIQLAMRLGKEVIFQ